MVWVDLVTVAALLQFMFFGACYVIQWRPITKSPAPASLAGLQLLFDLRASW
jgi:hypothetical protein